jgi:hypothetical protein
MLYSLPPPPGCHCCQLPSLPAQAENGGSRRHGQVRVTREACCLERFIERLNISILVDIYLTDSLIYSNIICVSAHLRTGWQQKPGVIHRHAKDAILKKLFPPVLLRICVFVSGLKKSQPNSEFYTHSVTNYFWYYSEVLFLVPLNSTSNSAETSSKNTIFLQGFGTIRGTIRRYYFSVGIFFPCKRNTVTTLPSPPLHCRHLRRCTAATFATVLPPPPPPPPSAPLPPLVPPESLLSCPCPLCRRRLCLHRHRHRIIVAVSVAFAVTTFS